ncbi:MAG: rhodanese-like domain-containing protein [Gammaproteobacteria bacterium]|nr:rhodanese-like domain-containing protein [Gammaproteobacteria bacterium]
MFYPTLLYNEVKTLMDAGAQLVDVRSPQEHRHHALPGSVNIPLPVIQRALKQLDRETPVLLYCATGQRSGTAKRVLEACGFSRVHIIGPRTFQKNGD